MIQDIEYAKTLGYFYSHSNENEVDGTEIAKLIIKYFPFKKKLKWLDVGCGPGGKLAIIAECLGHWGGSSIELDGLDPSEYWIDRFKRQLGHGIYGLKVNKTILSRWETYSSTIPMQRYDVVSFMHSVYGFALEQNRIPSLEKAFNFVNKTGLIIVAVESPLSDLYKIKKELFGKVLDFQLVDYKMVESTLRDNGISWQVLPNLEQYFILGDSKTTALSNAEALAFIVQTTPENYNKLLEKKQKLALLSSLQKRLKKNNFGYYITVPDRIYLIRAKDVFGS